MTPPQPVAVAVPALASEAAAERSSWAVVGADIGQLVRPKIALMVLATVATGFWLTAGRPADVRPLLWLLVGTALVAASSSIANQILERHTDRLMPRTADRPVAAGRLSVAAAWSAALALLAAGAAMSVLSGGWPATCAALATWVLYVAAYTPLKRVSPLNTAVGAVAGALPVAIGWLAADGPARLVGGDPRGAVGAAALGAVLYLWQFPHFMAIAWLYRRQYAAAGLQMLTVVDPSGLRAGGQSLAAALAMIPAALALAVPSAGIRLFLAAALAAIVYALAAVRFAIRRDDASARGLLLTSLGSLLGLLTAAVVLGPPA
ncbi:MAG: protoheme IX farnesyltransferase [Planctomycetaceae bacterium]|jgi:protoheme IX farnesyltransferase|nr:protoheme IX farnesyltransferase [Planctomycetaceae bacterium]